MTAATMDAQVRQAPREDGACGARPGEEAISAYATLPASRFSDGTSVACLETLIEEVPVALVYNGWGIALAMLGVVLLVQQVEGHVLQPLIMGTAVKVHPLGVVIAVTTGSLLAGIPGALFAVPIAAVGNVMILYIAGGTWKQATPPLPPETHSPLWRTVPQRPGFGR